MGLVELQPLSAGTAEAGAGAGAEGHDGEEGGRDDGWGLGLGLVGEGARRRRRRRQVASVRGGVDVCNRGVGVDDGGGRGGRMAHLEGEAVVFVDEEVGAGEGDVVGEGCAVLVDVVAVCGV